MIEDATYFSVRKPIGEDRSFSILMPSALKDEGWISVIELIDVLNRIEEGCVPTAEIRALTFCDASGNKKIGKTPLSIKRNATSIDISVNGDADSILYCAALNIKDKIERMV